ncbi:MAG: hypothetical protein R3F27_06035 [Gammaproteobacteria bacterium]
MTAPRLLLLLGQSPFDPTSGAAQSMRQIAELLATQGFAVRALATTGCEGDTDQEHPAWLTAGGGIRSAYPVSRSTICMYLSSIRAEYNTN